MTDDKALYIRIKDIAIKYGKSKKFVEFVKEKSEILRPDFNHAFGSYGSRKTTDYLGTAVSREEHIQNENNEVWRFEQVAEAIENLIQYAHSLENEIEAKSEALREAKKQITLLKKGAKDANNADKGAKGAS